MFAELRELSRSFIKIKFEQYLRYFIQVTPLKHRFAMILGERGIGKTTTLIQYLVDVAEGDMLSDKILYIQADHFLMTNTSLYEVSQEFYQLGGQCIAFDEIHKYPNWAQELKSIFDTFPNLRILASGSSALEIRKGSHDLARRAVVYRMYGLSLREFIALKYGISFSAHTFIEILENHTALAFSVIEQLDEQKLKILKIFKEYLEYGYYPYFKEFESLEEFRMTVEQNLHTTLEADLVAIYPHLTGSSIRKIKQLVGYLAHAVPFTPNWQVIKKTTEIGDDRTIKTYFKYLEDASIMNSVGSSSQKLKKIEDPEKIFLANPNQLYTFTVLQPNIGNLRETFFLSACRPGYDVDLAKDADFMIDGMWTIEVGGKNKDAKQIKKNAGYLALDDIEHGSGKRIPLWLFGFLY